MRFLISFFCCLVLIGCSGPSHRPVSGMPMPEQTFAHIEPLRLNATRVEVFDESGGRAVPSDFHVSLVNKTLAYIERKIVAVPDARADTGRVVVRIEEAAVERDYEAAEGFVAGKLGVGGADVYHLRLKLLVEQVDGQGFVVLGKSVHAQRRLKLSEHEALAKREALQLKSVEALFDTVDPVLSRILLEDMRLGNQI